MFDTNVLDQLLRHGLSKLPSSHATDKEKLYFHTRVMDCYRATVQNGQMQQGAMARDRRTVGIAVGVAVGRFGNLTRQNYSKYKRKEMAAMHAEQAKTR